MMQGECDGNDEVSRGAKMRGGRFDVEVLNSARDSSYLDEAQSLIFGVLLFSVDVCFNPHLLQRLLYCHEGMLRTT